MSLQPMEVTDHIEGSYIRYLQTAFHMKDPILLRQLREGLQQKNKFVKGPYLEVTAPYQTGASLGELIQEGEISPLMSRLSQSDIPLERPLYIHQETAIRKVNSGRNVVVSTGTGSGKTESFLIPILNELFRQKEGGLLTPGVRALLLYPMNALVNDQIKRLRTLLADTPEITFGRYTGETEENKAKAEEKYRRSHDGQSSLPNELLSREEMRESPPHLLITNYAMLEYLLLRPSDSDFFDGLYSNEWQFIVLDEAHTYNGATGIEVAMLLRRLKDRILKQDRPYQGSLRCIATSATLGSGEEAIRKVMGFASDLFGEVFEWEADNPTKQDYVQSSRIDYREKTVEWGYPQWSVYPVLRNLLLNSTKSRITEEDITVLMQLGYPVSLLSLFSNEWEPRQILYKLLEGDGNLFRLREELSFRPKMLRELTDNLIHKTSQSIVEPTEAEEQLTALVDLAVKAKMQDGDLPLLPARYHLFVRAIEGAYIGFLPKKKLFLEAQKYIKDGLQKNPVFELGVCRSCGQEHLIGEEEDGKLIQRKGINPDPDKRFTAYMILSSEQLHQQIIDEDEEVLNGLEIDYEKKLHQLCPCCSTITPVGLKDRPVCCDRMHQVTPIHLVKEAIVRNHQSKCHQCGARSANPIRLFVTGQDAATSVLSTALYHELIRSGSEDEDTPSELDMYTRVEDEGGLFSSFNSEVAASTEPTERVYSPQKLLVFSDSRQDAAFFATYLDRTYQQIIWRRLIMAVSNEIKDDSDIRLEDLVLQLQKKAEAAQLFDSSMSPSGRKKAIRTRLMNELLMMDRRISPEGVGLISFHVPIPQKLTGLLNSIASTMKVPPGEVWSLIESLLDSFRLQSALEFPDDVDPRDIQFQPRNRQGYMNLANSEHRAKVSSWIPAKAKMNRRIDYLVRIYRKQGMTDEEAISFSTKVLTSLWNDIFMKFMPDYFVKETLKDAGVVYKMSSQHWKIKTSIKKWYQCTHCASWTARNVQTICPSIRCQGELIAKDPLEHTEQNHYHMLYNHMIPMRMIAKEHTAQLSSDQASQYQDSFIRNEINVLSCSTTFEMGVDVGNLEAVFMRNVPPETSNYIQRAGRAGRRKSTTAFALTFAQRRSHDLAYFQWPEKMIAGEVKPPIFKLDNEKIVRRHMHSVAVGAFFKENKDYFKTVDDFFRLDSNEEQRGLYKIRKFLNERPEHVLRSLERIVPSGIISLYALNEWGWLREFISEEEGILSKAEGLYGKDMEELAATKELLYKEDKDNNYVRLMIKTLKDQQLLGYLSSNNVLPKYGFPVDVVELKITHASASRVSLSRDLKLAISEYAPGAEVVANGHMWKSIGVKRLAKYELPYFRYGHCKCGHYQVVSRYSKEELQEDCLCDNCGEALKIKAFIVPIFGFVSEREPKVPGEYRPDKAYNSRVFFSNYEASDQKDLLERQGTKKIAELQVDWKYSPLGKLAVVNAGQHRGYQICNECGVEKSHGGKNKNVKTHRTPWGSYCGGSFENVHLGHEFMSDVLELDFQELNIPSEIEPEHFWQSFLYGFLEGISSVLGIARNNIDGCLYSRRGLNPAVIIFDNVPGGAGYTREIPQYIPAILKETLRRMENCTCGEETSCYGCLRNYGNQYCHENLSRGMVIHAIKPIISGVKTEVDLSSNVLDFLLDVDESCRNIVEQCIHRNEPLPEIGYELYEEGIGVMAIAELAWPLEKRAVLLEYQLPHRAEFEKRGWTVSLPDSQIGF
jgi:superfamily II DNA or RNA helicase